VDIIPGLGRDTSEADRLQNVAFCRRGYLPNRSDAPTAPVASLHLSCLRFRCCLARMCLLGAIFVVDTWCARYGDVPQQLSAAKVSARLVVPNDILANHCAQLWAIMLRNSSELFIHQCMSRKFLDCIEDTITKSTTSPVVKERMLNVLAAAAYASAPRTPT
jgi:hypothetical protein